MIGSPIYLTSDLVFFETAATDAQFAVDTTPSLHRALKTHQPGQLGIPSLLPAQMGTVHWQAAWQLTWLTNTGSLLVCLETLPAIQVYWSEEFQLLKVFVSGLTIVAFLSMLELV